MSVKKIILFLIISLIVFSSVCSFASSDENLCEKYEFKEDFVYDDEIIAHALKASVVYIEFSYSADIEYEPVIFDSEYMEEILMEIYTDYESKYSEEELNDEDVYNGMLLLVIGELVSDIENNITDYIVYDAPMKVKTSGSHSGSGVIISEDGYIATNSHVASLNEDEKVEVYLSQLQESVFEDIETVFLELEEIGAVFSDELKNELYELVLYEAAENAIVLDEETELNVCFPSSSGDTKVSKSRTFKADIVAEGTHTGVDSLTQDTAILKIKADDLVSLKLSDDYPQISSKLVSAGYPFASDATFAYAGSDESELSVTITDGQVARLVPIKDSDYQAIQITSTISGGSSGGPSVDENLQIEGLNTYGYSADNRYAYMIPSEYIHELAEDIDIEYDEVSKTFLLGLQMLQNGYGTTAVECFKRVEKLQSDTPYIEELIELAEDAPAEQAPYAAGYNPQNSDSATNWMFIISISAVIIVVIVTIIIILIVLKSKKRRSNVYNNTHYSSNSFNDHNSNDGNSGSFL